MVELVSLVVGMIVFEVVGVIIEIGEVKTVELGVELVLEMRMLMEMVTVIIMILMIPPVIIGLSSHESSSLQN